MLVIKGINKMEYSDYTQLTAYEKEMHDLGHRIAEALESVVSKLSSLDDIAHAIDNLKD